MQPRWVLEEMWRGKKDRHEQDGWRAAPRVSAVADARICFVDDLEYVAAQVALDVFLDRYELHARVTENQIGMLLHWLEQREVGITVHMVKI